MNESLYKYVCWDVQRVGQVINREAVEMDSASFMATHTPMVGLRYETSEYEITDSSENGLLDTLIHRADNDRHTFVVLKGIPGTGKSHLIRWLKERLEKYSEQVGNQEVVMLIRRANSSLRNTIRQIIESDVFDTAIFDSYLDRLRDATTRLSETELDNRILNGLQEAAFAVREHTYEPPTDRVFSQRVIKDMPDFLMDATVRQYLMRSGGAVERIGQFLTGEGRTSGEGEEMPQFSVEDLDFPPNVLRELNSVPYPAVKNMVGYLRTQAENVVSYLNSLLNYAVSNLTTLTADQLKDMFGELRRQLRREGKSLTLLIEDITSFTGLDAGLIDVLIAQHGAENPEYCRLTSLIGVTDSYYNQYFRDNVRQRVTFLISLNVRQENEEVSHLLQSPEIAAQMAARYLNAIRLAKDEISVWYENRADPEQLPNACSPCPVRSICHATFGAVQIGEGSENPIGLYPFNQQAVWGLYTQIDGQRTTRTPRALVNNILAYVLTSHTNKIRQGQFPPTPRDLALDVVPPLLAKPAQRQAIETHIPTRLIAERFETLIRAWGDATIDTFEQDGQVFVGTLSQQVFETFGLPFFRGDEVNAPLATIIPDRESLTPSRSEPTISLHAQDIENWRTGGKLEVYQQLAQDLASFVKAAIEWELYGISRTLVDERITQARFEIEGQAGLARTRPRFLLRRSDELALVLHALDELRYVKNPSPEQIATNTTILHSWLAQNTSAILEYVQRMGADNGEPPLNYEMVLTQATYGLAVLAGDLVASDSTPRDIFLRLVASANSGDTFATSDSRSDKRSDEWRKATTALKAEGDMVRREFLAMLNCPQGTSSTPIYLDAARGILLVRSFKAMGLQMSSVDFPETKSPAWGGASVAHQKLAARLPMVLEAEILSFDALRSTITQHTGESPEAAFAAITTFTQFTERVPFEFPSPNDLTAKKLNNRLAELDRPQEMADDAVWLTQWLSGALKLKRELANYAEYFQQLSLHLKRNSEKISEELTSGQSDSVVAKRQAILALLTKLHDVADELLRGE
jgi:hypothetical protein